MTTDTILERVLDRLETLAASVATLNAKTEAIVERLDKINGSVQRHEQALNEHKLWQTAHEQKPQPRIKDRTILQVAAMLCGTILTVYGVQVTGLAQALLSILK